MKCLRMPRLLLAPLLLGGAAVATASGNAQAEGATQSTTCHFHSDGNKIQRVVHIVFDNVHLRRDNPNVPSDLEQMPHLLDFMLDNGTVSGNHYTPLISHTAHDIVTVLTGVYGDRSGIPVANSYGFFRPDGSIGFSSSFLYWTSFSNGTQAGGDGLPEMVNEKGLIAPAPWVPFTRAGCDVGAFSVANIEFETVPNDVTTVFGAGSPQDTAVRAELASSSAATRAQPSADYLGIAIHCAKGSALCNNGFAAPDLLPNEPGGYTGFQALYGNINVQPVISPSGPIKDLDGNVIANSFGHPGFPNSFDPSASQTLGYAATMLEAGVQVVYLYIEDAHDSHFAGPTRAFGPGEAGYVEQLQAFDAAFAKFFMRLAADGITKDNTLFVITADENDHPVAGPPSPPNCDGVTVPCTYAVLGEVDAHINRILATERNNTTPFSVHSDDAPTFYINGNPAPTSTTTRQLEHDVNALTVVSPITGNIDHLSYLLADQAAMKLLHMVTFSPARTPSFTMFGNPNYFDETSSGGACPTVGGVVSANGTNACLFESNAFVWNHGDVQRQITRTWFGMVGPGVPRQGRNDLIFSDHADLRPTELSLLGLTDDYVHEGRVLVENLDISVVPRAVKADLERFLALATAYKQINAPLGSVGHDGLVYANKSINSSDARYADYLSTIGSITTERDGLASEIIALLNGAAFGNSPIDRDQADHLLDRAWRLIARVHDLAEDH